MRGGVALLVVAALYFATVWTVGDTVSATGHRTWQPGTVTTETDTETTDWSPPRTLTSSAPPGPGWGDRTIKRHTNKWRCLRGPVINGPPDNPTYGPCPVPGEKTKGCVKIVDGAGCGHTTVPGNPKGTWEWYTHQEIHEYRRWRCDADGTTTYSKADPGTGPDECGHWQTTTGTSQPTATSDVPTTTSAPTTTTIARRPDLDDYHASADVVYVALGNTATAHVRNNDDFNVRVCLYFGGVGGCESGRGECGNLIR